MLLALAGIIALTIVGVLVIQDLTEESPPPTPDLTLAAYQAQSTQLAVLMQTQTAVAQVPTPTPTAQVLVVTATPEPQVIVITNAPLPSPQVIVVTATTESPPVPTAPQSSGFTRSQVDNVIGAGNWQCFPDRLDGVAIQIVNEGFVVSYPLSAVDKEGIKYLQGQSIPGVGSATAWLAGSLRSRDECPVSSSPVALNCGTQNGNDINVGRDSGGPCNSMPLSDFLSIMNVESGSFNTSYLLPLGQAFDRNSTIGYQYSDSLPAFIPPSPKPAMRIMWGGLGWLLEIGRASCRERV